jgi:capsular polysaccharide biosynthesis protein
MDVAPYLAIGRRWWWLLILGAMSSVAAYGVVARLHIRAPAPPTYTASSTLFATLPPPPDAQLAADPSKRPWELDRLMATYVQVVKSRTVAERAVRDARLTATPDELAARVTSDAFGYTQLLRITVAGTSVEDAEASLGAVVQAFGEVRVEHAIPGDAAMFERSATVRIDTPTPEFVNIAIVVLAGFLSAAGIVIAFEYLSGGAQAGRASHSTHDATGAATLPLAGNERA